MKLPMKYLACCAIMMAASSTHAATTVGVDPSALWLGYMNIFERPANGGGYVFGQSWGTTDLSAVFTGSTLTLSPNTIGDPATFWYQSGGGPGALGNKIMDASFYVQPADGTLTGQTLTFTGNVLSNTFTSAHVLTVFIKDFAPDYSSSVTNTAAVVNGFFSIDLALINDPARHVQYGFQTIGVNVWSTDVASFGSAQITAVPEPSGAVLFGLSGAFLLFRRRNS